MSAVPDMADVAGPAGGRGARRLLLPGLVVLACAAVLASLGVGAVAVPPGAVIAILLGHAGFGTADILPLHDAVVTGLRLPRTLLGFGVGAALAVGGAMIQGLFRNPLADPGLVGVSAGAALAVAAVIVLGVPGVAVLGLLGPAVLPGAAFLGSLAATLLVARLARREDATPVATLLLTGIAVNAIAAAGTGFFIHASDERQLRDITFWTLGSLGGATWTSVAVFSPFALLACGAAWRLRGVLDALLLGEREAALLGHAVERGKLLIVVLTALAVGASVAAAGGIGFVGLVVPHVVRLAAGARHAVLLPACALLGGSFLLGADLLARTATAPAELPIGLITGLVGGPFFLWLLSRRGGLP